MTDHIQAKNPRERNQRLGTIAETIFKATHVADPEGTGWLVKKHEGFLKIFCLVGRSGTMDELPFDKLYDYIRGSSVQCLLTMQLYKEKDKHEDPPTVIVTHFGPFGTQEFTDLTENLRDRDEKTLSQRYKKALEVVAERRRNSRNSTGPAAVPTAGSATGSAAVPTAGSATGSAAVPTAGSATGSAVVPAAGPTQPKSFDDFDPAKQRSTYQGNMQSFDNLIGKVSELSQKLNEVMDELVIVRERQENLVAENNELRTALSQRNSRNARNNQKQFSRNRANTNEDEYWV